MTFVLFTAANASPHAGISTEAGVIDASSIVPDSYTPQAMMVALIDGCDTSKSMLEKVAAETEEPNDLRAQFWNDGQLRHNHMTDEMKPRNRPDAMLAEAVLANG